VKALVLSDLHFEFHRDGGQSFVESLPEAGVDVVLLAGDIAVGAAIPAALALFCERYPEVVYVHGNHEFYNGNRPDVMRVTEAARRAHSNLHFLDCTSVTLGEIRFLGAPLWFRPGPQHLKSAMSDFSVITDFESWVYEENARAVAHLDQNLDSGDVVVTHHLPSERSVAPEFAGSPLNAFFVCDIEALIRSRQPRAWIHGHTHASLDYHIGDTRVVCNPFGYARIAENAKFTEAKLIEL
jgi:Icc-related predicted phosphoesterase